MQGGGAAPPAGSDRGGADDRERLVDSRFSKARLSFKVKDKDANKYRVFVTSLEAEANRLLGEFGEITTTGTLKMFTQTISLLMESLAVSYTIAGVVITLLMILLLGSVRIGLLSMIPNLAPIMITLGVMGWLGIKLDMSNMLVGTIAIGLAVDDTIHFFHNFRSYYTLRKNAAEAIRDTMLSTGRAMFFTTLVLVTGFMFFAFASLTNLVHFGILISSTLVLALLADMLLSPAMMELIPRPPRGRGVRHRDADTRTSTSPRESHVAADCGPRADSNWRGGNSPGCTHHPRAVGSWSHFRPLGRIGARRSVVQWSC